MTVNRRSERGKRIELQQSVRLVTSEGHAHQVTLRDLSRDGFKIALDGVDLVAGEIVTISTTRSDARAQVQWVSETEAGGTFVDEPDVTDFEP
jgi:hypothetical protein